MITNKSDRHNFIGGSEAHYLYMGFHTSTFKNWWANKLLGFNEPYFENINMAVGTILEHDVIDLYEQLNNITGERDGQRVKGIARANTDFIYDNKVSDVKVSQKATQWHTKEKVPIKYKRQLVHYLYVTGLEKASVIAYQADCLENPFDSLKEDNLFEIEVPVSSEEINEHEKLIEHFADCKEKGVFPNKI